MGGMAAQIPIKNDPAANEAALEKVRQDKLREVRAGHDGTWVAHPGLVPIAKEIFDEHMKGPNQICVQARGGARHREGSAEGSRAAPSPKRACAGISMSGCNTWKRGCAEWAASPFTT